MTEPTPAPAGPDSPIPADHEQRDAPTVPEDAQTITALRDRIAEALRRWQSEHAVVCEHTQIVSYGQAADAVWAEIGPRWEHLHERNAELAQYELGIKSLTTSDGSIDMSLAMAHDMMRIFVAAFVEILDKEGGPNFVEMSFKLRNTLDRYTVTLQQPNGKTPGEVASDQRRRADQAELELERLRRQIVDDEVDLDDVIASLHQPTEGALDA